MACHFCDLTFSNAAAFHYGERSRLWWFELSTGITNHVVTRNIFSKYSEVISRKPWRNVSWMQVVVSHKQISFALWQLPVYNVLIFILNLLCECTRECIVCTHSGKYKFIKLFQSTILTGSEQSHLADLPNIKTIIIVSYIPNWGFDTCEGNTIFRLRCRTFLNGLHTIV